MALSDRLTRLIDVSAPLWAGEAEVVRTYWDSPVRNHDSELLWLRRQCSKEFNGTGIGEYKNMGVFMGRSPSSPRSSPGSTPARAGSTGATRWS